MPFIGNKPADSFTSFAKQDFTTSATTSYTLDYPVTNANEIALFINFVRQEPTTAYSATGTSLTLTSATSATDDMYAVFLGKALQTVNPPAGSVGTSQIADGSITSSKLNAGKVLQVVSTTKTDTFSSNPSNSWIDITGLSATITPISTSSKIYVVITILGGGIGGVNSALYRLVRDSTVIYAGDSAGSRGLGFSHQESQNSSGSINGGGNFLDSPSTLSATTYKIQATSNNTIYINRTADDTDTLLRIRGASTITLMEISG